MKAEDVKAVALDNFRLGLSLYDVIKQGGCRTCPPPFFGSLFASFGMFERRGFPQREENHCNIIMSPFSVSSVMAMVTGGCER